MFMVVTLDISVKAGVNTLGIHIFWTLLPIG